MPAQRFDGYPINSFLLIIKQCPIFRTKTNPDWVDLYDALKLNVLNAIYTRSLSTSGTGHSPSIDERIYLKLEGIRKFARVFHHFYSFKSLIKLLFSTWVRFLKIISRIRIELNNAIQRWRKPYRARGEKNSH